MIEEWEKKLADIAWISEIVRDGNNLIFDIYVKSNYKKEVFYIDYSLKLQFNAKKLPTVYELENRLDLTFGHINFPSRSLCIATPISLEERLMRFSSSEKIQGYMKIIVEWFTIYKYWEKYGKIPDGERAHYGEGLFQDYRERFEVFTDIIVLKIIANAFDAKNKVHQKCPCYSGKSYGKCHYKKLSQLISRDAFRAALISDYMNMLVIFINNRYITDSIFRKDWTCKIKNLKKDKTNMRLYYCRQLLDTVTTRQKVSN